jgi:hypothetical protein
MAEMVGYDWQRDASRDFVFAAAGVLRDLFRA